MKKIFLFSLLAMLFGSAAWGVSNPLEVIGGTVMNEAEATVIPIMLLWVIGFGALMAFTMRTLFPLFMAIILAVVIAMAPNLAVSFAGWFGDSANVQTTMGGNPGF